MNSLASRIPPPANEPVLDYAPGSPSRASLKAELDRMESGGFEVPLLIGGKEVRTGKTAPIPRPDDHGRPLGLFHLAGEAEVEAAVDAALAARPAWAATPLAERAAIFRRAAALVAGKYRASLAAATMLGQSKTVHQAEIDAIAETADFYRINGSLAATLETIQPDSAGEEWNRLDYRSLEGFIYAVSPFNFTAIAANLASAPALMGNVVVWKPASTSILSNWFLMRIYEEAGLPPGVINFIPGQGSLISARVFSRPEFAGLHFTGSTEVMRSLWQAISAKLPRYRAWPRIVGETGGKGFIFVDPSADRETALVAALRGAFEYQGQKCSAASRLYLPRSLAPTLLDDLAGAMREIKMGKVSDFRNFMGAVIDESAYSRLDEAIDAVRGSADATIVAGGRNRRDSGWFIEPTLVTTTNPRHPLMETELFGPLLTAFVYDESDISAALRLVDSTSPYGLTGAIIARDRVAIDRALMALRDSAGNLYVNDKPTGAVVGRQPFGGMRASGTNDKAGSLLNLLRWTNPGAVKENFSPPTSWRYPSMLEE